MKKLKIEEIVLDFNLYPRTEISETHARRIADVLEAGKELPPIVVQKRTLRVIDGFHRVRAHRLLKLEEISCDIIDCNDVEAYKKAVELNSAHGRPFTPYDYRRIVLKFDELGISRDQVVDILNIKIDKIKDIKLSYGISSKGKPIALKRTINFMKGKKLTKRQEEANERLGGMSALFWVNQLIELLESDLWQPENEELNLRMNKLTKLWEEKNKVLI